MAAAKGMDGITDALTKLLQRADLGTLGKASLHSNESITKAAGSYAKGSFGSERMFSGISAFYQNMQKGVGMNPLEAIKAGHMNATTGNLNVGAVAGSYMGVSAAARVAGGGGLHRDRHGNPNIIGVPFF